tara:strand:+ start:4946 stop:5455 length:510 start_codon:yes stop_codon:yes gene_type:complete
LNSEIQFAIYSLLLAALGAFSVLILKRHPTPHKNMSGIKQTNPNETLMITFGMGVVMAWVVIAATASYFSIVDEREITDSQLTVIGLLGGPALLIITSVLDLFKGKESAKIAVLPDRLSADVESTNAAKNHTRKLEELKLQHDLDMEAMQQKHTLDMEAFQITKGKQPK